MATGAARSDELCGVGPDGVTSFSMIQAASDSGNAAALVFFLFDLLYLDGEDVSARPLIERKQESLVDAGGRCSQHRKSGSHGLSAGDGFELPVPRQRRHPSATAG
jgi:bifunctional non-homologous end joining protein LigD